MATRSLLLPEPRRAGVAAIPTGQLLVGYTTALEGFFQVFHLNGNRPPKTVYLNGSRIGLQDEQDRGSERGHEMKFLPYDEHRRVLIAFGVKLDNNRWAPGCLLWGYNFDTEELYKGMPALPNEVMIPEQVIGESGKLVTVQRGVVRKYRIQDWTFEDETMVYPDIVSTRSIELRGHVPFAFLSNLYYLAANGNMRNAVRGTELSRMTGDVNVLELHNKPDFVGQNIMTSCCGSSLYIVSQGALPEHYQLWKVGLIARNVPGDSFPVNDIARVAQFRAPNLVYFTLIDNESVLVASGSDKGVLQTRMIPIVQP